MSGPLAQLSKKNATGEAPLCGVELWPRRRRCSKPQGPSAQRPRCRSNPKPLPLCASHASAAQMLDKPAKFQRHVPPRRVDGMDGQFRRPVVWHQKSPRAMGHSVAHASYRYSAFDGTGALLALANETRGRHSRCRL